MGACVCGRLAVGAALAALLVTACRATDTPAAVSDRGAEPAMLASTTVPTDTPSPTATLTPTPTATATLTPTPTPTATPLAAHALEGPPAGQLVFGTMRHPGQPETLWRLVADGDLVALREDVAAGLWDCASGAPLQCAVVTSDGGVYILQAGGEQVLLDGSADLTDQGANRLALASDGSQLALGTPEWLTVYDLARQEPTVTLLVTGTKSLVWSPDSAALAFVYRQNSAEALGLWRSGTIDPLVVAQMDGVDRPTWSPGASRLAFFATRAVAGEDTPVQYSDLFLFYPASGEVRNLTEAGMPFPGRRAADAIARWPVLWQPGGEAIRYVRGDANDPLEQVTVLRALDERQATELWPVAEEGELGIVDSPQGHYQARVVARADGHQLQIRADGEQWSDSGVPATDEVQALLWQPTTLVTAGEPLPFLLIIQSHALRLLDATSGQLTLLAESCPTCRIIHATWLPNPTP